jgi:hypothetical protein
MGRAFALPAVPRMRLPTDEVVAVLVTLAGWLLTGGLLGLGAWPLPLALAHLGLGLVIPPVGLTAAVAGRGLGLGMAVALSGVGAAVVLFVTTLGYVWSWIFGSGRGLHALLALVGSLALLVSAALVGALVDMAEEHLRVFRRLPSGRWIGESPMPSMLGELLELPGARGFALSDPFFRYAVAAGSAVVFVHVPDGRSGRVDFVTARQRWQDAFLRLSVRVRCHYFVVWDPRVKDDERTASQVAPLEAAVVPSRDLAARCRALLAEGGERPIAGVIDKLLGAVRPAAAVPAEGPGLPGVSA